MGLRPHLSLSAPPRRAPLRWLRPSTAPHSAPAEIGFRMVTPTASVGHCQAGFNSPVSHTPHCRPHLPPGSSPASHQAPPPAGLKPHLPPCPPAARTRPPWLLTFLPQTQRTAGARLAHVETRRTFSRVFPALAGSDGLPGWSSPRAASADWAAAEKKPPPGFCGLKTWHSLTELFCFDVFGIFPRSQGSGATRARAHARAVHSGARARSRGMMGRSFGSPRGSGRLSAVAAPPGDSIIEERPLECGS